MSRDKCEYFGECKKIDASLMKFVGSKNNNLSKSRASSECSNEDYMSKCTRRHQYILAYKFNRTHRGGNL